MLDRVRTPSSRKERARITIKHFGTFTPSRRSFGSAPPVRSHLPPAASRTFAFRGHFLNESPYMFHFKTSTKKDIMAIPQKIIIIKTPVMMAIGPRTVPRPEYISFFTTAMTPAKPIIKKPRLRDIASAMKPRKKGRPTNKRFFQTRSFILSISCWRLLFFVFIFPLIFLRNEEY